VLAAYRERGGVALALALKQYRVGEDPRDLVATSGREDLPVADRVGLLRAALLYAPLSDIPARSVTREIHDLKLRALGMITGPIRGASPSRLHPKNSQLINSRALTVGWIRGAIKLYDDAVARGETEARLSRGAHLIFSPVECLVLAWKRNGHCEFRRVRAAQRERCVRLWAFVDPQPQNLEVP
jgi:hypothetical protein